MKPRTKLVFVVIGLTIFGVCCVTSTRTPSQTVRKSYELLEKGDIDGCTKLMSKQSLANLDIDHVKKELADYNQRFKNAGGIRSVEILKEDILGDNAEVTDQVIFSNGDGFSMKHKLIKEDGEWKISSTNPTSQKSSLTSSSPSTVASLSPTPIPSPITSKIVMRFIWFGGNFSAPIQKADVTIYAGGQTFQKRTSSKGWIVLDGVPCNQNARIVFGRGGLISRNVGESPFPVDGNNDFEVTRSIACSDKPVALGAFSWEDGNFISDDMDNIDACFTCQ